MDFLYICHRSHDANNIKKYTDLTPKEPLKSIIEHLFCEIEKAFAWMAIPTIEYDLSTDKIFITGNGVITDESFMNEMLRNCGLKTKTVSNDPDEEYYFIELESDIFDCKHPLFTTC